MSKLLNIDFNEKYDVVVIGAGPAAVSSSIYAARKGLKVAMVGEFVGGQVLDTNDIENIIGINKTTGFEFGMQLENHLKEYEISFYKGHKVEKIENIEKDKIVIIDDGNKILTKTIIIATGAKWRELGIPGEKEYLGKGVHYCSTCDGPFYRNKKVVVIGGGNSGVEAALDLANIASHITLLEYMPSLKADKVLQDKIYINEKIDVLTNVKTIKVEGNVFAEKLYIQDRETSEEKIIEMDGMFIEIGLSANSVLVKDIVKLNKLNEIEVDEMNMTSIPGIFAAGDCTDTKHKQIIIAMGEGAKAALGVFEYLLKEY